MDAVFERQGQFYFWDEVGADSYGPYDTDEEARKALSKYCEFLNGEITKQEVGQFLKVEVGKEVFIDVLSE